MFIQHSDELRRQGIAYDRIHGRQSRCENDVSDCQNRYKQLSRSVAEIGAESMSKMKNSRVNLRPSQQDMRSELSRFDGGSGILNYQMSMTEFNTNEINSNNSSASFD